MAIAMRLPNKRVRQYFICFVGMVVVILYILSLVGCVSTSPGIPGIFLVKLTNNATEAEVRVGLFGMCAGLNGNLSCATTIGSSLYVSGNESSSSSVYALPGSADDSAADDDLQTLLAAAVRMQSSSTLGPGSVAGAIFVPLIMGCIFFVTAVAALLTHSALPAYPPAYEDDIDKYDEESPHRARAWQVVGVVTTYSVAAAVAAGIATLAATRALQFAGTALPGVTLSSSQAASDSTIVVDAGTALPVLQWMVVALTLAWHLLMTFVWRRI